MPTPEQVRSAVETYVASFNRNDREGWLAAFAEDAEHFDPVGTPPNVGREAIGAFWDRVRQLSGEIEFTARDVVVCGAEAAVPFTVSARGADGGGMEFDGVDLFAVDDEGLIASLRAYWDPVGIRPLPPPS